MIPVSPLILSRGVVAALDQTRLPEEEVVFEIRDEDVMIAAIRSLQVRGAPVIGAAGACAGYLAAYRLRDDSELREKLPLILDRIEQARPTAVNLRHAIQGLREVLGTHPDDIPGAFHDYAQSWIRREADAADRIAVYGAELLARPNLRVMTICNAGPLAALGAGTALGVIAAMHQKHPLQVWVCETRPLLQGARITTWELARMGVPHTLLTDNMAASLMAGGMVDLIVAGADRIAANGDTANKIGTLGLAALGRVFGVPIHIAAPGATIDPTITSGEHIPIEHRDPDEVRSFRGQSSAPPDCPVYNPAFDVTPGDWIASIITELGPFHPPYRFTSDPR
jgi:methylthioribose-1-phosphate isomerase